MSRYESGKYKHPNIFEWTDTTITEKTADNKANENPVVKKTSENKVVINPIAVGLKWVKDKFIGK